MGPGRDRTRDPWICSQTRLCYRLRYAARSSFLFKFYHVSKQHGDPDQMPHSAASGLGLHCLPISNKKDARLKWVTVSSYDFT